MNDVERLICKKIVESAIANDYKVSLKVEMQIIVRKTSNCDDIIDMMGSSEEEYLIMHRNNERSFVHLIYGNGNDGWDVVTDYGVSLSSFMDPIIDWVIEE